MDKSEKVILIVLLSALGGCLIIALLCGAVFFHCKSNYARPQYTDSH